MKLSGKLILIITQLITVISSSLMKNGIKVKPTLRQRKSELMCDQYVKMFEETRWVILLSNRAKSVPIPIPYSNCRKGSGRLNLQLIAEGRSALQGEFPHMAALSWLMPDGKLRYFCSGSLISEKWIMTSAHCTHGPYGIQKILVHLGFHQLNSFTEKNAFEIKSIKRRPNYDPPTTYEDIALLELKTPVTFGQLIKPACLQTNPSRIENSMKLLATGWGVPYYGAEPSGVLMKAELEVISNSNCANVYKDSLSLPHGIAPSMMCAGDVKGGWKKDTCKGDSGGPLQQHHPNNCLFEIVGITSIGKWCGIAEIPGVYMRVSSFIDWIEEIVWPDD